MVTDLRETSFVTKSFRVRGVLLVSKACTLTCVSGRLAYRLGAFEADGVQRRAGRELPYKDEPFEREDALNNTKWQARRHRILHG